MTTFPNYILNIRNFFIILINTIYFNIYIITTLDLNTRQPLLLYNNNRFQTKPYLISNTTNQTKNVNRVDNMLMKCTDINNMNCYIPNTYNVPVNNVRNFQRISKPIKKYLHLKPIISPLNNPINYLSFNDTYRVNTQPIQTYFSVINNPVDSNNVLKTVEYLTNINNPVDSNNVLKTVEYLNNANVSVGNNNVLKTVEYLTNINNAVDTNNILKPVVVYEPVEVVDVPKVVNIKNINLDVCSDDLGVCNMNIVKKQVPGIKKMTENFKKKNKRKKKPAFVKEKDPEIINDIEIQEIDSADVSDNLINNVLMSSSIKDANKSTKKSVNLMPVKTTASINDDVTLINKPRTQVKATKKPKNKTIMKEIEVYTSIPLEKEILKTSSKDISNTSMIETQILETKPIITESVELLTSVPVNTIQTVTISSVLTRPDTVTVTAPSKKEMVTSIKNDIKSSVIVETKPIITETVELLTPVPVNTIRTVTISSVNTRPETVTVTALPEKEMVSCIKNDINPNVILETKNNIMSKNIDSQGSTNMSDIYKNRISAMKLNTNISSNPSNIQNCNKNSQIKNIQSISVLHQCEDDTLKSVIFNNEKILHKKFADLGKEPMSEAVVQSVVDNREVLSNGVIPFKYTLNENTIPGNNISFSNVILDENDIPHSRVMSPDVNNRLFETFNTAIVEEHQPLLLFEDNYVNNQIVEIRNIHTVFETVNRAAVTAISDNYENNFDNYKTEIVNIPKTTRIKKRNKYTGKNKNKFPKKKVNQTGSPKVVDVAKDTDIRCKTHNDVYNVNNKNYLKKESSSDENDAQKKNNRHSENIKMKEQKESDNKNENKINIKNKHKSSIIPPVIFTETLTKINTITQNNTIREQHTDTITVFASNKTLDTENKLERSSDSSNNKNKVTLYQVVPNTFTTISSFINTRPADLKHNHIEIDLSNEISKTVKPPQAPNNIFSDNSFNETSRKKKELLYSLDRKSIEKKHLKQLKHLITRLNSKQETKISELLNELKNMKMYLNEKILAEMGEVRRPVISIISESPASSVIPVYPMVSNIEKEYDTPNRAFESKHINENTNVHDTLKSKPELYATSKASQQSYNSKDISQISANSNKPNKPNTPDLESEYENKKHDISSSPSTQDGVKTVDVARSSLSKNDDTNEHQTFSQGIPINKFKSKSLNKEIDLSKKEQNVNNEVLPEKDVSNSNDKNNKKNTKISKEHSEVETLDNKNSSTSLLKKIKNNDNKQENENKISASKTLSGTSSPKSPFTDKPITSLSSNIQSGKNTSHAEENEITNEKLKTHLEEYKLLKSHLKNFLGEYKTNIKTTDEKIENLEEIINSVIKDVDMLSKKYDSYSDYIRGGSVVLTKDNETEDDLNKIDEEESASKNTNSQSVTEKEPLKNDIVKYSIQSKAEEKDDLETILPEKTTNYKTAELSRDVPEYTTAEEYSVAIKKNDDEDEDNQHGPNKTLDKHMNSDDKYKVNKNIKTKNKKIAIVYKNPRNISSSKSSDNSRRFKSMNINTTSKSHLPSNITERKTRDKEKNQDIKRRLVLEKDVSDDKQTVNSATAYPITKVVSGKYKKVKKDAAVTTVDTKISSDTDNTNNKKPIIKVIRGKYKKLKSNNKFIDTLKNLIF
ncbi:hypothetical protein CDIK_0765 [Cucumispora dikerogammari]|nr:hypothetical protein CDIK_0765 [Cucumispora dikerogammari]